jgi:DNA-binding MarR family transcriptional regulator
VPSQHEKFLEFVVIPRLITSGELNQKTIPEALTTIMRVLKVKERQARSTLHDLEEQGYVKRDPDLNENPIRIIIIKKGT